MMLDKKIIVVLLVFLLSPSLTSYSYAQNTNSIELSLVPQVGFSFSYFEFDKDYSKNNFIYLDKLSHSRDFYWGLGIQAAYNNDWYATINISEFFLGGGLKWKNGQRYSVSTHYYSNSLTIEKKYWNPMQ